MTASTHEILIRLAQPHDASAVRWRVGQTVKPQGGGDPTHGRALAYIDARDCEDRLDEVMGVNWQSKPVPLLMTGKGGEQELIVVCSVGLFLETAAGAREWVWRSNGSGETDYEGVKGAFSKAFVRAASAWGIGRFLYAMGSPKVKIVQYGKTATIDRSEEPRLAAIVRRACDGYAANPRMRPLVHEEETAAANPEPTAPSRSPRPAGAPEPSAAQIEAAAIVAPILSATTLSAGLTALTMARQNKKYDAIEAEKAFASFVLRKIEAATEAKRADWLQDIEGCLARAGIGAEPNRRCRDMLKQATAASLRGGQ